MILGTVDFSPIAQAESSKGQAKGIAIQQDYQAWKYKQDQGNTIVNAVEAGVNLASKVYGVFNESYLAEAKANAAKGLTKTKDDARNDFDSNQAQLTPVYGEDGTEKKNPDGTPILTYKMPDTRASEFAKEQEAIEDKYRYFPEVKAWALGQLEARKGFYTEAVVDTARARNTQALDKNNADARLQGVQFAIQSGNMDDYYGIVDAQPLTQGEKDYYKAQGTHAIANGIMTAQAKKAAQAGGLASGYAAVDAYTPPPGLALTPEDRAAAKAQALVASKEALTVSLDQATQGYTEAQKAATEAKSAFVPDLAIKAQVQGLPEWQKAEVEDQLRKKQANDNWTREIQRYDTQGGRFGGSDLWAQIEEVKSADNPNYIGDEDTRKKVLDLLQQKAEGFQASGSAKKDQDAIDGIAGTLSAFQTGDINQQEAIKRIQGRYFDRAPEKAQTAIEEIVKTQSPEYAKAIGESDTFINGLVTKKQLTPEQGNMLKSVIQDDLRSVMIDTPIGKMSAADYSARGQALKNLVTAKSFDKLKQTIFTPGWFKGTDAQMGELQQVLDSNPTIAAALVNTDAHGNVVFNPNFKAYGPLYDRQRAIVAETLGKSPGEVVQGFMPEGAWDVTAQGKYTVQGDKGFYFFKAPKGTLELYHDDGSGNVSNVTQDKAKAADATAAATRADVKAKQAAANTDFVAQQEATAAAIVKASPQNQSTVNLKAWLRNADGTIESRTTHKILTYNDALKVYVDSDGNPVDVTK